MPRREPQLPDPIHVIHGELQRLQPDLSGLGSNGDTRARATVRPLGDPRSGTLPIRPEIPLSVGNVRTLLQDVVAVVH